MAFNEADTRAKLINPGLYARGWHEDLIRREATAKPVDIIGGKGRRRRPGRIDYVLRLKINPSTQPLAIALIEAKPEDKHPAHGLEQGKAYARAERYNVPFVFSSNGHKFVEFDRFTMLTSEARPLSEFPTPEELRERYERAMGFNLADPKAKPLLAPYRPGAQGVRYYQDAAIRAVLEKIARGGTRVLLTLATGTGKTLIAVNVLKRIADAGQLRRALFICDRDELRNQGAAALSRLFGSDAANAFRRTDGSNNAKNARVHVATFQMLGGDSPDGDSSFLDEFYPPGHFSHIIIDECHRSAWGRWSEILKRNPDAVQIGLTATPRSLKVKEQDSPEAVKDAQITADNIKYFGEPVYSYDIAQGVEDGYLAACEIVKRDVFLESKPEPERQTGLERDDLKGKRLTDAVTGRSVDLAETSQDGYDAAAFERELLMPDRVTAMCQDLFNHLLATGGPEQKTIIFCVRDSHAADVARVVNNLYAQWAQQTGNRIADPYAFRCTDDAGGQQSLPDLKGAERAFFVATTVDLLSTGVDVEWLRNVVFFRYLRSPILFYQMVGRGTRIHEPSGKLMFRVYDYTNATRLLGEDFITGDPTKKNPSTPDDDEDDDEGSGRPHVIMVEGLQVRMEGAGQYVLMKRDGKDQAVPFEEYKTLLGERLLREAATPEVYRAIWVKPVDRRRLIDALVDDQFSPRVLQLIGGMDAFDDFDVLGEAAYGFAPRTRADRAESFKWRNKDWLNKLDIRPRAVVTALADQFALGGTAELESAQVFHTPAVRAAGGIASLKIAGEPHEVLEATKKRMFSV